MAERSGEFSIIDRFFSSGSAAGPWFCKGIGDDCAIIDFGDSRIAVTIDMLAMGTHIPQPVIRILAGASTIVLSGTHDLPAQRSTWHDFLPSGTASVSEKHSER